MSQVERGGTQETFVRRGSDPTSSPLILKRYFSQKSSSSLCFPFPNGSPSATRTATAKKAIGLDQQNNNSARDHAFLHISLPSLHDYNVQVPNFTFCRGQEHKTTTSFSFSWTLKYSPLEFNSKKCCQHLTNYTRWNERDKVKAERIHFLSDLFVTVAIVVA